MSINNYAYQHWDNRLSHTQMGISLHAPYQMMVIRRGEFIEIGFSYGDPIFRLSKRSTEILLDIDNLTNHIYRLVFINVERVASKSRWGKNVSVRTIGGKWVECLGSGKLTIKHISKNECKFEFSNIPLERNYCKVSAKNDRENVQYVIDMVKSYSMILASGDSPFPMETSTRERMGTTLPYAPESLTGKRLYEAFSVLYLDKDALYQYLIDFYKYRLHYLTSRLEVISRNMDTYYRASGTVKYLPLKDETFGI